ncbi:hypothetical protein QYE76_065468 [Lolium multiflorum]|uniref:Glycosyltransferase n=1 Tax=Lolium multiflorum TaxID=4521 RepID=A0AAD8S9R4_LOLMU|nr:hypothetical protein QYE76_065468 [Lolium multiflorum]
MAKGHIMVLPFPAQGHVVPLMELSHRLVNHGFEVTFVNTEVNHALVLAALPTSGPDGLHGIHLASIPDGLADDQDRKDLSKLIDAFSTHMSAHLEKLVGEMEAAGRPRVKWLVGDLNMGWSFEVAVKLGIRVCSFWPVSAACLAIMLNIPDLIQDGVLNHKGWPEREETLQLGPGVPPLHTSLLSWNNTVAPAGQPTIFQLVCQNNRLNDLAEIVVCNSFQEAEAGAFKLFPGILPIGPLLVDGGESQKPVGNFLPEDTACLQWLDARPRRSVVYVAFGTFAVLDPRQFQELAEGLELTGRPFLWAVRPDFTTGLDKAWLHDFQQRVTGTGMIVSWCPQRQVLAHPAVGCFLSHCGWNSMMEAATNGMPVLCWPYFCEQFLHRGYITDVWRTGLAVSPAAADGVVTKEEVRSKVDKVITDQGFKERARWFKDAASRCIAKGGSSQHNFTTFVDLLSK